jgi:hypothetical protein
MRPTRRRRRVTVLPYFYQIIRSRYVCVAQFLIPRGTQTTKPLFSLFPQFQCHHLPNIISAIIKPTLRQAVCLSQTQKCF